MATVIIFATTAVFVGCKKEDNKVVNKVENSHLKKSKNMMYDIDGTEINFDCGYFHNFALENIINRLDDMLERYGVSELDDVSEFVDYFYIESTDFYSEEFYSEEYFSDMNYWADKFKNFVSIPDFYETIFNDENTLFDGENTIFDLLNRIHEYGIMGDFEYGKMMQITNLLQNAINLPMYDDEFCYQILQLQEAVYCEIGGELEYDMPILKATLEIANASIEFWSNGNIPYREHPAYAPPVVAADVGGAIVGAASSALNQYVTTGKVNAKGVLVGAGVGAVTTSAGMAIKAGTMVCNAAAKAGKFIRSLF